MYKEYLCAWAGDVTLARKRSQWDGCKPYMFSLLICQKFDHNPNIKDIDCFLLLRAHTPRQRRLIMRSLLVFTSCVFVVLLKTAIFTACIVLCIATLNLIVMFWWYFSSEGEKYHFMIILSVSTDVSFGYELKRLINNNCE